MLKSFFTFFETRFTIESSEQESKHSLELATAALMFEISRADHEISVEEKQVIMDIIRNDFNLSDEEAGILMAQAENEVNESVSLWDFSGVIRKHLDYEERLKIIQNLWRVAYADNSVDKYEEYFIRKIADLLYISHGDYIREKFNVLEAG